jgi:glycosyltransferase involved in cell wall biosynthesis
LIFNNFKQMPSQEKRLLWISWLQIDLILHKTSVIEVLEALARRGYNVTLFVARSRNRYVIKTSGINTVQVPLRQIPALSSIAFAWIVALVLPYYILFKRPTYIVTDANVTILGFFVALILRQLRKVKLVLEIRSTPVEVSGFVNHLLAFFFDISVLVAREFFDGMTVITNPMKEEICNKFGVDPNFPGIWTSGVSKTLFDPNRYREEAQELRRKLGLTDKFVVFYHGVFSARRGLIECVRSMASFKCGSKTNNCNVLLFFLGGGGALSAIKEEVARCGVEDSVVIHDPVDYTEVPAYIAMCDVAISALPNLPDWRYQSPLNVLEYLSMEKAVIATDIPAHRQIMGDSKCAIYTTSAEPNELTKAINYAFNNWTNLLDFGTYGRHIIEQRYTWDKIAENFDKYLSGL